MHQVQGWVWASAWRRRRAASAYGYVQIWHHPENRKYVMYHYATRVGPSHEHRRHAQKIGEDQTCSLKMWLQTDTHRDIMFMTILCWPIGRGVTTQGDYKSLLHLFKRWLWFFKHVTQLDFWQDHYRVIALTAQSLEETLWTPTSQLAEGEWYWCSHRDPLSVQKGRRPYAFVNVIRHSITSVAANQSVLWVDY